MNSESKKIIFLGTPEVAVSVLASLLDVGYEVSLVITSPDRPVGRKQTLTPPPVKTFAESKGLKVYQPEKLGAEALEEIQKSGAELGIVVAYGHIIPQAVIDALPKGFLNIHYSLLPEFRGASPVEQAILSGQEKTGTSIQKLIFKLDAGPIVAEEEFELDNKITTPELKNKLTEISSKLLVKILPAYLAGEIELKDQDESKATHCKKISKSDGEIKISDKDEEKWRKYRAYFGWPGIFYFDEEGNGVNPHKNFSDTQNNNKNAPGENNNLSQKFFRRVKITEATFENGKFILKKIIPEGKKEISL